MAKRDGLAMSWGEWAKHDGLALAKLVRERKIHPREIVRQAAAGVARVDDRLEGVLELFDDVLANPDVDRPARTGRLYGVPIFLKDLGSGLAGRKREWGSRLRKGEVAKETDPTIANFLAGGMIPIGRSTCPEFGLTFDTSTSYLGKIKVTRNPWKLDRTAGGSSGGSAAMVAAGVTPVSMASDGGGSTRIPASYCGLVGLKGTRGRVPRPVGQNEGMVRVSIEGVVSRSVRDSAAALDYLARVPSGGTFMRLEPPRGSYLDAIERAPKALRIALSTGSWGREGQCDPQVAARVREVAQLCESLGHRVEEVDDSAICEWEPMWRGYISTWIISRAQFRTMAEARQIDPKRLQRHLDPMSWRHYVAAARYGKWDIWNAWTCNDIVTRAFGRFIERYDALLTPTLAIRVPQANGPYSMLRDEDLDVWVDRLCDACRYTMPGNETGMPGISVPAGLDRDGAPIGAMFYAGWAREDLLLALAAQIEAAKPEWFTRLPPMHVGKRG